MSKIVCAQLNNLPAHAGIGSMVVAMMTLFVSAASEPLLLTVECSISTGLKAAIVGLLRSLTKSS